MKRIVLTGGPGAGKTVISRRIAAEHPGRFVLVPEAASQVYVALQTRWDQLDMDGRRDVQRRIYALQLQQEQRISDEHPGKILLLDRGTLDGAAYWPGGADDYWAALRTSAEAEVARYDTIIWLESCAALGLYDGDQSNPCRCEDAAAAVASGETLLRIWQAHPNLHRVPASVNLEDKLIEVYRILSDS